MVVDKRGILQAVITGEITKEQAKAIPKFEGSTVEELYQVAIDDKYHLIDIPSLTFPQLMFIDDWISGNFISLDRYKD